MQGIAGGVAGGLLGSMIFGGVSHAGSRGGMGGSGIGLFEILVLCLLAYLGYKFFKRRRAETVGLSPVGGSTHFESNQNFSTGPAYDGRHREANAENASGGEVERGFQMIRGSEPGFSEARLMDELQDLFFRIQAAWTNRSVVGIEDIVTSEMKESFAEEFESMKAKGILNRLENIAIRKGEPTEVWQETDKDYVTILFTASLLDYTIDEKTGAVISGDKFQPVSFREFWTFCREIEGRQWKLSAVDQLKETVDTIRS